MNFRCDLRDDLPGANRALPPSTQVQRDTLNQLFDKNEPSRIAERTEHLRHAEPEFPLAQGCEQPEFGHGSALIVWLREAVGDERVDVKSLPPVIKRGAKRIPRKTARHELDEAHLDFALRSR